MTRPSPAGKCGTSGPARRPARRRQDRLELGPGQDRVGEERPGAAGVRIAGVEHHALARPQLQHRGAGFAERHPLARRDAEFGGQLGIADAAGPRAGGEPEGDGQHDEPPGGRAGRERRLLEEAGPVTEAARRRRELSDPAVLAVVDAHAGDRVGHFLAVGADVLDRGGAGQPRDPGQAFQPGQPLGHAPRDHVVPVLPGRDGHGRHVPRRPAATSRGWPRGPPCRGSRHRRSPRCCRRRARRPAHRGRRRRGRRR